MRSLALSLLLVVFSGGHAMTAVEARTSGPAAPSARAGEAFQIDYKVGPGDLLALDVSGLRQFEQSVRVSNSGRIRVPYAGVLLVTGMTTFQVEQEIARVLSAGDLINQPSVRVRVEEYRARPTYVLGEVTSPGQFMITGDMYLLDLLSKAGGTRGTADKTALLFRRTTFTPDIQIRILGVGDPGASGAREEAGRAVQVGAPELEKASEETIRIDLDALTAGTRPEMNIPLEAGDILYVPQAPAKNIFIIGEVPNPGAYFLPRRGEVSAGQAVIYAGGLLPTASSGKAFMVRAGASGTSQARPVDFRAIIRGTESDFPVQEGDIIFIPRSGLRSVGNTLLLMVPNLISQILIF